MTLSEALDSGKKIRKSSGFAIKGSGYELGSHLVMYLDHNYYTALELLLNIDLLPRDREATDWEVKDDSK